MAGLVVLFQQVLAEIAGEIAPHAVDMVGAVLHVVVFNQEGGCLNPVVVRVSLVHPALAGSFFLHR